MHGPRGEACIRRAWPSRAQWGSHARAAVRWHRHVVPVPPNAAYLAAQVLKWSRRLFQHLEGAV
eukprot:6947580-Prymnesium_polylepis.1